MGNRKRISTPKPSGAVKHRHGKGDSFRTGRGISTNDKTHTYQLRVSEIKPTDEPLRAKLRNGKIPWAKIEEGD
jgi:hypothetical protein